MLVFMHVLLIYIYRAGGSKLELVRLTRNKTIITTLAYARYSKDIANTTPKLKSNLFDFAQ